MPTVSKYKQNFPFFSQLLCNMVLFLYKLITLIYWKVNFEIYIP